MEGIPDIEPFRRRFSELDDEIAQPDFFQDQRRAVSLSREQQRLSGLLALHEECEQAEQALDDNREMLRDEDAQIREMAEEEEPLLEKNFSDCRDRLLLAGGPVFFCFSQRVLC